MEKKINKSINLVKSLKLNYKDKKISGNLFAKNKTVNSVKAGKTIKGKINLLSNFFSKFIICRSFPGVNEL